MVGASDPGYGLAVDLGTTASSAAVHDHHGARIVAIGTHGSSVPSALWFDADGRSYVGDVAVQRGRSEPDGLVVNFKRRLGDSTPIRVRGTPRSAESLMADLLVAIVAKVHELEGRRHQVLVLTHPANWGPYRLEMLDEVARLAGVGPYGRISEPEAAALRYADLEKVDTGSTVAVYDLGGGTFDVAVLECVAPGHFEFRGRPEGIDKLGGIDFDDALVGHVLTAAGLDPGRIDPFDRSMARDLGAVRASCVEAKEALSEAPDAVVAVRLGELAREVRVTRRDMEELILPLIERTADCLERALASAGVEPARLGAVLLVGGSSRVPVVARTLQERLGRPVLVDAHPKEVTVLGAALRADVASPPTVVLPITPPPAAVPATGPPVAEVVDPAEVASPAVPLVVASPPSGSSSTASTLVRAAAARRSGLSRPSGALVGAALAGLALVAVLVVLLLARSTSPPATSTTTTTNPVSASSTAAVASGGSVTASTSDQSTTTPTAAVSSDVTVGPSTTDATAAAPPGSPPTTPTTRGTATSTSPPATPGLPATTGTSGPPPTVPDVTGQTQSAAERRLQTLGYGIAVQTTPAISSLVGIVIRQIPGPGANTTPGATLTIVVGVEPPTTTSTTSGLSRTTFQLTTTSIRFSTPTTRA